MKCTRLILLIGACCLSTVTAWSQFQGDVYLPDTNASLFNGTQEKTLGFAGGFNNPQFAIGDLNNDNNPDLVIFERGPEWVRTFINYGTAGNPDYRYRPQYEKNFPPVKDYLKLIDYNCDNIPDLVNRGSTGFSIYTGGYNAVNEIKFNYYRDLFYSPLILTQEGFESTTFPPLFGWQASGMGWTRETTGSNPSCSPFAQSAMTAFNSATLASGTTALLISKRVRISPDFGPNAKLSFWIYRNNASTQPDSISVYIDTVPTVTNSAIYIGTVARCRTINQPDTKSADGWYQYSYDLPQLVGDTLYMIFKGISHNGNNIYIDNIEWVSSNAIGDVNAYVEPSDIPSIVDVDNDGDLDFFSYYIAGAYIDFYKNYQVEDNLPCSDIRINLKDACWGKVYQGYERTQHLGSSCTQPSLDPGKPSKTTHTGNTLCLADVDGDADYDYFNGNISFSDIQFFKNGRIENGVQRDSMIYEDTTWQLNGTQYAMDSWPATFWLDIDNDGDNDLIFSPHAIGSSENKHCVKWYKNVGTNASPNYLAQNDSLFTSSTVDLGTVSYPMLYDYNRDGKLDLFIGSSGLYAGGTNLTSRIEYYENTTSGSNITFQLIDGDFLGLYAQNIKGASLATGDIDNDSKDDLLIGHSNGTISLYSNTATNNNMQPVWQLSQAIIKDQNNIAIDSGSHAAPFIYDMDNDGKKDLLIGSYTGALFYYRNMGGSGQLMLQYQTRKLGGVKVDGTNIFSAYSTPYIGRIDNVNKDYLVLGSNSGRLYKYTGFQNGNVAAPYQVLDSIYSLINSSLDRYSGFRSAPSFGDLNNDGMYEMVLGNVAGGVTIFRQSRNVSETVATKDLDNLETHCAIYPNPVSDVLYVSWDNSLTVGDKVTVEIFSLNGQKLLSKRFSGDDHIAIINIDNIATGTYFCKVQSNNLNKIEKFIKTDCH
jgi:hypothetical protein